MAKASKDLTSWSGGIVNAVEPSDTSGDDSGTFSIKNLDGTTKMGVLRPAGRMINYQAPEDVIELIDQTNAGSGGGFEILPLDYSIGTTDIFNSAGKDMATVIGTNAGSFTLGTSSIQLVSGGSDDVIALFDHATEGLTARIAASTWYSYEMTITASSFYDAIDYTWVSLDTASVESPYLENSWSEIGFRFSGGTSQVSKGIFRANGSTPFGLRFFSNSGSALESITVQDIKITKLAVVESHEAQLVQNIAGGNTTVDIYMDGGNGSAIGTPIDTITLGEKVENPDLHFMRSSNAVRIFDSNFNNLYFTKFFGMIDREFFEDVTADTKDWTSSNIDSATRPFGIKRKYWISEDSALSKPNVLNCVMPCMGDMINYEAAGNSQTSDLYFHRDLSEELELQGNGDDYLIRLEYAVIKDDYTKQTGQWNEAEDGQDGTNVDNGEKSIQYKFFCSFVYDGGAQESELTQITQVVEQGSYWNPATTGYITNGYKNYKDVIKLYYHDSADAYSAAGKLPVHTDPYQVHPAWDCKLAFRPTIMPSTAGASVWNFPERCTGVMWYYATSSDGFNKRYRIVETDFRYGIRFYSSSSEDYIDWKLWSFFSGYLGDDVASEQRAFYSNNDLSGSTALVEVEAPPEAEDWDGIYGMKSTNWPDIRYKTAVVVGGQAYYGNVKVGTEIHRDRVLVSIANHGYDMIPDDNFLDVVPGDGDEIIHLLTYSQQLYVFKRNKLVICDVGGEEDSVASEHLVGGINSKHQATVTSKGIFFVNKHGAFLASGDTESLVLGKISTEIKGADIEYNLNFTADSAIVTHAGTETIEVGMEIGSSCLGGNVSIVESVTSSEIFVLEDKAITTGTPNTSAIRPGSTVCFWSLRDEDNPIVGYNPREEQVFILNSTVKDTRKHFWKYDLKDSSFWYHDGHYTTTATGAGITDTQKALTHAANTRVERGMLVYLEGNDALGLNFVDVADSTTSTTLTNAATATVAGGKAVFVGGSFKTVDTYSNFGLDKQNRMCILGGDTDDASLYSRIVHWNKEPSSQNIFYDTGLLDFGSPSTWKQLYKVTIVAKNADSNMYSYMYGVSPDQNSEGAFPLDEPALFGLTSPNGMNSYDTFRATHHKVSGAITNPYVRSGLTVPVTYELDDSALIAAKSLFFKLIITNKPGNPVPVDFELHSITFVYRDKGIK